MDDSYFPQICSLFSPSSEHPSHFLYNSSIRNALRRLLPQEIDDHQLTEGYTHSAPVVKCIEWGSTSLKHLSILLLCRYRPNATKFFYDLINRWLVPGRVVDIGLFFSTDFRMGKADGELFSISEIVLSLDDEKELELIKRNFSILEPEIRMGVTSSYHASRIMEVRGLSIDEKTSLIHEKISSLIHRRPRDFDYDIYSQMQQFLVMCREEFKAAREYHHMSLMISVFYLFRKELRKQVEKTPTKRFLSLKIKNAKLKDQANIRGVIALFVGLNFLKKNEIFEQHHLIKTLQNYIPGLKVVEDSFFVDENRDDNIQTIYLEVEKKSGEKFSLEEIKHLRKELPEDLKNRVEQLMRPVFMPRNEEEVMRHIVTLSQQLRYVRDLPQVVISFDEQTDTDLTFTIVLVRILSPESLPIQDLFLRHQGGLKFIPDRVKRVGVVRNKYPKEATVFRVRLPNTHFLREDHSLDLLKARQEVIYQIQGVIGEVRDFNGGMIAKQLEVFKLLRHELGEVGRHHEFLLENFFHSLFPVQQRSVVNPESLKSLFLLLLSSIQEQKYFKAQPMFYLKQEIHAVYAIFPIKDHMLKLRILELIEELNLLSSELVSLHLQVPEAFYLGFIYFTDVRHDQDVFLKSLNLCLSK